MRFNCDINDVELKKYNTISVKFNINVIDYNEDEARSFAKRTALLHTIRLNICDIFVGESVRLLNEDFRKFSSPNLTKEEFNIDPYIFKLIEKERKNNEGGVTMSIYIDILCFNRNDQHIDLYISKHENYKIEDWNIMCKNIKRQQSNLRYIITSFLHIRKKDRLESKVLFYFYKNKIMIKEKQVSIDDIQKSTDIDRTIIIDVLLNKLKKYIVCQVPDTSKVDKDYKGYVFGIKDDKKYKEIGRLILFYRFKEKFNKRNFRMLGMILITIISIYKIISNIGNPNWQNDIILYLIIAVFAGIIIWILTKE